MSKSEDTLINHSSLPMPRKSIQHCLRMIRKHLSKEKIRNKALLSKSIVVVFLSRPEAKALNKRTRGKNYATDILSFAPVDSESLGELVICPEVIRKQANEHDLTIKAELSYMLLHGVLHLLGYDHEMGRRQEKEMFSLQDRIFDQIRDLI